MAVEITGPAARPAIGPAPLTFRIPLAFRSALRRWRGILGATFGVGFALSVVVAMLSLSVGESYLLSGEYSETDVNIYVLMRGGVVLPLLPGDTIGQIDDGTLVLSQVRTYPEVREAVGARWTTLQRDAGRNPDGTQITEPWTAVGVFGNPDRIPGMINLQSGIWLRQGGDMVVGPALAASKNLHIGDTVIASNKRFEIVGIGVIRGIGYGSNSNAYITGDVARDLAGGSNTINLIMVDSLRPAQTIDRLQSGRPLQVLTREQALAKIDELSASRNVVFALFSVLALGVAGLFIATVLGNSVRERRTEFATMLAIGLPGRTILSLVLVEALVITLIGYVIGVALGIVFAEFMNVMFAPIAQVKRIAIYSSDIFIQVLIVALVLGLLAGIFPALSALRVQPAESLREA